MSSYRTHTSIVKEVQMFLACSLLAVRERSEC